MCGRYVLKATLPDIARMLGMEADLALEPSYNIAPTRAVPVCRSEQPGKKELVLMHWGLIPHWAKQRDSNYRMINARAETIAEKPAFRSPFRHRRCLIPADGYYEWKSMQGRKQPYYFSRNDDQPFCFAGLWDRWQPPEGAPVESCTIITTEANGLLRPLHPRMPVILDQSAYARWLDPGVRNPESHKALLVPYADAGMCHYPVSKLVNSPVNG